MIVTQKEGVNITIDGNDREFNGTIEIYGQARHTGAETLTIKNVNFVTNKTVDFIFCNTTESAKRYAHNVTVEDCTFTATSGGDVVGMRWRQCYNIVVKNSTFTGMHSVVWATGCNSLSFEGITAANCKNGISVGTTSAVTVKNSTIDANGEYGYGFRADASGAYTLTATGNTIKADAPILLRKATGAYSATFEGNTLTNTGSYQIIVTASDYAEGKELTAATGTITLTGADGYTMFK